MRYVYEIDDNNTVWIWDTENPNENNKPFFMQPDYPDGTAWNREEAEAWVLEFIASLEEPTP